MSRRSEKWPLGGLELEKRASEIRYTAFCFAPRDPERGVSVLENQLRSQRRWAKSELSVRLRSQFATRSSRFAFVTVMAFAVGWFWAFFAPWYFAPLHLSVELDRSRPRKAPLALSSHSV